jgi:regulator of protease activity HflC (stomatin/prohibitin superfamily)
MTTLIIVIMVILGVITISAIASVRIIREYERGVVFRLGRIRPLYEPGVRRVIPGVERLVRVDLRVVSLTIPPQEVITRDNVPARVNVVLFRVIDPIKSVMEVENHAVATSQIAQTTLRSLLGREDLDTLLAHREDLNERLRGSLGRPPSGASRCGSWRSKTSRSPRRCSARWLGKPRPSGSVVPRSSTPGVSCRPLRNCVRPRTL